MTDYFICSQDKISETQPSGFTIVTESGAVNLLIVKQDGCFYGYHNDCPHLNVPLNWQPDQFLSLEHTHIQCATHGALFNIHDGYCIAGPCAGERLQSLTLAQREGGLWLQDDGLPHMITGQ